MTKLGSMRIGTRERSKKEWQEFCFNIAEDIGADGLTTTVNKEVFIFDDNKVLGTCVWLGNEFLFRRNETRKV